MRPSILHDQRGAILLLVLLLLTLGGLSWLLGHPPAAAAQRNRATERALAQAKEALLGYAATYPEHHLKGSPPRAAFVPGHLPCPDTGSTLGHEGTEAGSCGSKGVTVLGHFPWRSLGTPPLRDGSGECLWYAVSGNYKANPKADLLNTDTLGQYQILAPDGGTLMAGTTPEEQPVAVLIAPGAPLPGQQRKDTGGECRWDYDPAQYLEARNGINHGTPNTQAGEITRMLVASPDSQFNDRLLWITREEIQNRRAAQRPQFQQALFDGSYTPDSPALTQRVAACLALFGNTNPWQRLPWAAPLELSGSPPDQFRNDRFSDQSLLLAGRPPFSVGRSQQILSGTLGTLPLCPPGNPNHSSCRLLRADNCPELLPVAGHPTPLDSNTAVNSDDGWWDKWKDHLFYVVAPGFSPATQFPADCRQTPSQCLEINGQAYAAVVIFSGDRLPGQSRNTGSQQQQMSNYLEGANVAAVQSAGRLLELAGNDQFACLTAPTADDPQYRLVPNCGNLQCSPIAEQLLSRLLDQGCGTSGFLESGCQEKLDQLAGCSCLDEALALTQSSCRTAPFTPSCQSAQKALRNCP